MSSNNRVAFEISQKLAFRLSCLLNKHSFVIRPFELTGHHPSELLKFPDLKRLGLKKTWNSELYLARAGDLEKKFIEPWAEELLVLYHNASSIQFFELEIPKHQFAANYAEIDGVFLRVVVGYDIGLDEMIIRLDTLVKLGGA